jgi:hypothetical protein
MNNAHEEFNICLLAENNRKIQKNTRPSIKPSFGLAQLTLALIKLQELSFPIFPQPEESLCIE